jgi:hypothetical protein
MRGAVTTHHRSSNSSSRMRSVFSSPATNEISALQRFFESQQVVTPEDTGGNTDVWSTDLWQSISEEATAS